MIAHRHLGWFVGALLVVAAVAGGPAPAESQTDDPILARAFEVRYRPLADAADVVGEILSSEGQVSFRPRLKILVVEDRSSVLDRVQALLESFDLAPRGVRVTMALFLGTKREDEDRSADAPAARGVIDLPALRFTHWKAYESLGSRSVQGTEGDRMTAELSNDYRVIFTVQRVDERQGVVKFDNLSLQRLEPGDAGDTRVENLYSMGISVDIGKQQIVGAAAGPDADRALFLTLLAEAR